MKQGNCLSRLPSRQRQVSTLNVRADEALAQALKDMVATDLGKPLRPEKVFFVSALPRTRNAKVMRRIIRAAYLGEDPGDVTALENPAAVEAIHQIARS